MPEISIIVPVYNLEKTLLRGVESILKQTFTDFELILINDGSTDNSIEVCREIEKRDDRVLVIDKNNEGAGLTRNRGIELAKGKYIAFFDGDDVIENNMLDIMYSTIEETKVDLVICNFNIVRQDNSLNVRVKMSQDCLVNSKEKCRETYIDLLEIGLMTSPWNKLYRKSIINKNNIRFTDLKRGQDAVFNGMYYDCINSYKIIKTPLYNYYSNTIELEWMKFPEDYFDICKQINRVYTDLVISWGEMNKKNKEFLSTYFINDVISCIFYSFNPKLNFKLKDQKKYIFNLINDSCTIEALKYNRPKNFYKKIMHFLIKNKLIYFIILITSVLITIRKKYTNIFNKMLVLLRNREGIR